MMIEAFKRFDSQALGSDKVGECSGEREGKFGKTPVPPHTTPMNQFSPKPNQTHKPREKPSEKPSEQGNKHKKKAQPTPKAKPVHFHCEHYGRDGHKREFCFRRIREERLAREMANKDR
jgi:outer membrane biosynthesis protein TonB